MNGTQKMVVALVAIFVAAGVVIGGFVLLGGSDDSPSAVSTTYPPVAPPTVAPPTVALPTESTEPDVPAPAPDDLSVKVDQPTGVRAQVKSGTSVLVQWNASSHDVRYFQVYDDGRKAGGKIAPSLRHVVLTTSYGTHCFRVMAVAVAGARSSSASSCGTVTVAKPAPPPPGSYNPPPGSYNPPPGSYNPPPSE